MKLIPFFFTIIAASNAGLIIHPQPQFTNAAATAYSHSYSSLVVPNWISQPEASATLVQNAPTQLQYASLPLVSLSSLEYEPVVNSLSQPQGQIVQYQEQYASGVPSLSQPGVSRGLSGIEYIRNSADVDTGSQENDERRGYGKYWVTDSDGSRKQVEYSAADLNGVLQPRVPSVSLVTPQNLFNGQTNGVTEAFYDQKTPLGHLINAQKVVYQL